MKILGKLIGSLALSVLASTTIYALDCKNAISQHDMNTCAMQDFNQSDQALNTLYNDYQKRPSLSPEQKKQLIAAQKAWVQLRDADCRFEASGVDGGSAHPMIEYSCLAGETDSRIKRLQAWVNCKEGDLSCPAF